MKTDQLICFIDNLIETYRKMRKGHIKKRWLNFRYVFGRVRGQKDIFDQLRKTDLMFFCCVNTEICKLITGANLTSTDLDEVVILLRNHRSALSERDFYLIFYAAIISILLLLPRNNFVSFIIAGIAILFFILAFSERWNMKQYDVIYSEVIEFLLLEAKKRS